MFQQLHRFTLVQQCVLIIILVPNVARLYSKKKKKKIPGHESCPVPRKTQQTDNHGLAPKAFFAHKERLKMDLTNKEYKGAVWTRVAQDRVLGS